MIISDLFPSLRERSPKLKKFTSFFIALFLVLSTAGCGTSQASTTTAKIEPAVEMKAVEPVKGEPIASATPSDGVVNTTTVLAGKKLTVSYIDVGQGDSILIQTPGGKNILIDAGNNGDATTIVTYLKAQNISRLDYVIATHSHEGVWTQLLTLLI